MSPEPDVLVIGAGPAGAATALQLARAGFAVTLADKKSFPRHKPCGEFLSPECVPYLDELGLGNVFDELRAHRVHGMRLSVLGGSAHGQFRQLLGRGNHGRAGFGVRRERFDAFLVQAAQRAGVTFLPRHEFVALSRAPDGTVIGARMLDPDGRERTVNAQHVVGADGVHSRVAKALGVQRRLRWLQQMALVAHYRGVPTQSAADVHLLPSGFFAATTVDAGLHSVNLVVPQPTLAARRDDTWDAFVHRHLESAPALRERLQGSERVTPWRGIGPLAFTTRRVTSPGIALVGDAAGYVDPLTGEGIYYALFGAKALGEALTAALHCPAATARAMVEYGRHRRRELAPRLFAARLLQRGLRHPWLVRRFVGALQRWPLLADLVVTMTGDTIHPRELWRPSFWRAFGASA